MIKRLIKILMRSVSRTIPKSEYQTENLIIVEGVYHDEAGRFCPYLLHKTYPLRGVSEIETPYGTLQLVGCTTDEGVFEIIERVGEKTQLLFPPFYGESIRSLIVYDRKREITNLYIATNPAFVEREEYKKFMMEKLPEYHRYLKELQQELAEKVRS